MRTGYGTNLPQGTLSGEFSATNTTPPRSANVSGVPQSVQRALSPTSLLFPSNIGSYALNSASGAGDAAGSDIMNLAMEPSEATDPEEAEEDTEEQENVTDHGDYPMEVDDVTQSAAGGAEDEDVASVAADMWLDDDVQQSVAGGPRARVSIQTEEEDDEADAVSLAADLWLETPSAVAGGAADAHVAEEAVGEYDNNDPASLAADVWLDAQGTQLVAGHADNLAPTTLQEAIQSVAVGAVLSATPKEEEEGDDEEDNKEDNEEADVNDAASVAADTWLMGEGTQSVAGGAAMSAPINEEEEEDDEEDDEEEDEKDDVNDAASVAADAWLMGQSGDAVGSREC